MLTLKAQVLNVFLAPEGTTKDGVKFGGDHRVQLQGLTQLRNGEQRMELLTLSTKAPDLFKKQVGKVVSVEVGVYSIGKQVQYFLINEASAGVSHAQAS